MKKIIITIIAQVVRLFLQLQNRTFGVLGMTATSIFNICNYQLEKSAPSKNHKLKAFCEKDNCCNYSSGRQIVFTTSKQDVWSSGHNGNTATTPDLKP